MVVMAIIAILATAGLSAYTGYLKKARDATRIADVAALNTIAIGAFSSSGKPLSISQFWTVVSASNNGQPLIDPLNTKTVCLDNTKNPTACNYTYRLCDAGTGYVISARFESQSNIGKYTSLPAEQPVYYIGSCKAADSGQSLITVPDGSQCAYSIDCVGGPGSCGYATQTATTKTCGSPKGSGTAPCNSNDECASGICSIGTCA